MVVMVEEKMNATVVVEGCRIVKVVVVVVGNVGRKSCWVELKPFWSFLINFVVFVLCG